jgi:hypothetical protein
MAARTYQASLAMLSLPRQREHVKAERSCNTTYPVHFYDENSGTGVATFIFSVNVTVLRLDNDNRRSSGSAFVGPERRSRGREGGNAEARSRSKRSR